MTRGRQLQWCAELYTDHQIEVLKIPQNLSILSEPTKWCERAMYDGRIMDDTNPIFAWAVQNVMIFRDSNDNVRPHKGKSKGRIDPVIAVVNAVAGKLEWDRNNPEPRFLGMDLHFKIAFMEVKVKWCFTLLFSVVNGLKHLVV